MATLVTELERARRPFGGAEFHFTPAEWRMLLEDPEFLRKADNSYLPPRRLKGVPVAIVPDHEFD